MARTRPRTPTGRLRRGVLVFAGALAVHAWVFFLAGTQSFHPRAAVGDYAQTVTPVVLAPPLAPLPRPPPRRRSRPPQFRPIPVIDPAPTPVVAEPPQLVPLREADTQLSPPATAGWAAANSLEPAPPGATQPQAGAGAAPSTDAGYPINPGYWEVVEHWPLIDRTERYCVPPEAITRFMAAPCNHIYHCAYPVQAIEAGRLHFAGVIWKTGERYNVHGGGEYSPTSLRLNVSGLGHWHVLPFAFAASLDGRFLGADCPAGAKRISQNR